MGKAFALIHTITILQEPLFYFGNQIGNLFDFFVSIQRIQRFLLLDEINQNLVVKNNDVAVKINDGNFFHGEPNEKLKLQLKDEEQNQEEEKHAENTLDDIVVLRNIDITIQKGSFVCIIGEVGCGKSSLLSAILGDLRALDTEYLTDHQSIEAMQLDLVEHSNG